MSVFDDVLKKVWDRVNRGEISSEEASRQLGVIMKKAPPMAIHPGSSVVPPPPTAPAIWASQANVAVGAAASPARETTHSYNAERDGWFKDLADYAPGAAIPAMRNALSLLFSRLRIDPTHGVYLKDITHLHVYAGRDIVRVFYVKDGTHNTLEERADIFPSDEMLAQFRLLME